MSHCALIRTADLGGKGSYVLHLALPHSDQVDFGLAEGLEEEPAQQYEDWEQRATAGMGVTEKDELPFQPNVQF